jgi:hypothetical protein
MSTVLKVSLVLSLLVFFASRLDIKIYNLLNGPFHLKEPHFSAVVTSLSRCQCNKAFFFLIVMFVPTSLSNQGIFLWVRSGATERCSTYVGSDFALKT